MPDYTFKKADFVVEGTFPVKKPDIPMNAIVKILCANCKRETNHKKVWEHKKEEDILESGGEWVDTCYEVLVCQGCESVTLRETTFVSLDVQPDVNGEAYIPPTTTLYPKRIEDTREECKASWLAPPKVKQIYRETIDAFNNKMPILCAAGVRATVEAIARNVGILEGNLENKIDQMVQQKIITSTISDALHETRIFGNESLHETVAYGDYALKAALDLLDSVMEMQYMVPINTRVLKARK